MAQYIPKDALVAVIKRHIKEESHSYFCKCLLAEIDALEVKEVDLEKEFESYMDKYNGVWVDSDYIKFSKHFFELGLSASNPTTAADRGMAEEVIINLKRVEQDYRIDLTKEIEWVRNKVRKGE